MNDNESTTPNEKPEPREQVTPEERARRLRGEDTPGEVTPAEPNVKVVYTTETGEEPKGGPILTKEATAELPPPGPTKTPRKTTTKKRQPRTKAKAEPLHKDIRWDPKFWADAQAAVRPGERLVIDSETEAHTEYVR